MNSIFGRYNFETGEPVEEELINKMCHALDCYGQGRQGIFCQKEIGIGIRSLSTDKLESPYTNENESIRVVFEGLIYDSQHIRSYLLQKGHFIRTRDDGELVVHLYEEMGEECIKKINGIFAFAIWDKNLEKLLLFRDRLGFKSVFYTNSNGALIFASEIKSILQNKDIKKEVDVDSLHYFLSFNYVPAPLSLFKNIKKLPPAHYLACSKGKIAIKKYWDLRLDEVLIKPEKYYTDKLFGLLETAVRRNLEDCSPAGLLLSGGMDSSTIGFLMTHLQGRHFKTFTLGFSEQSHDERSISRLISKYLGTEHHEALLEAGRINTQGLKEIIYSLDEPIADPAVFPCYCISKFLSKHVKVVLSGEGGDELFAGYESYIADELNHYFMKLPFKHLFKHLFSSLASCLPVSDKPRSLDYKIKSFFRGSGDSVLEAHCRWRQFFSEEEKKKLLIADYLSNKVNSFEIYRDYYNIAQGDDLINRLLYVDLKVLMPDSCLRMFEAIGKSASIEIRAPLLDCEVVEFLFKIPSGLKLKRFTTKYLLRKTMATNLPHEVFRRRKIGMSAPINIWFKKEWKNMIVDMLSNENTKSQGYFNQQYIQQILNEHFKNIKNNSWKILSLVNFHLWHKLYIGP